MVPHWRKAHLFSFAAAHAPIDLSNFDFPRHGAAKALSTANLESGVCNLAAPDAATCASKESSPFSTSGATSRAVTGTGPRSTAPPRTAKSIPATKSGEARRETCAGAPGSPS